MAMLLMLLLKQHKQHEYPKDRRAERRRIREGKAGIDGLLPLDPDEARRDEADNACTRRGNHCSRWYEAKIGLGWPADRRGSKGFSTVKGCPRVCVSVCAFASVFVSVSDCVLLFAKRC